MPHGSTHHPAPIRVSRRPVLATLVTALVGSALATACIVSGKDIGRPCKDGRCPAGMACISNACEPATDAGVQDAGSSDAGAVDGGAPDAGSPDAGAGDGGILLLEGHIGSGGGTVDDGNGLRLLDPGFETGDRTCTSSLCGQGGIQP